MMHLPFYVDWVQAYVFWATFFCIIFGMGWFPCTCCEQPCPCCQTGTKTSQIQIEFTGVVNSGGACTECGDYNTTTFLLSTPATKTSGLDQECEYDFVGAMPCDGSPVHPIEQHCGLLFGWNCNANKGQIDLLTNNNSPSNLCSGGSLIGSTADLGDPIDCSASTTATLSAFFANTCNFNSATATITPL